jgi:hypothetical protein
LQDDQQRERHGHREGERLAEQAPVSQPARGHDDDPGHREARRDQRSPRGALPRERERHARAKNGSVA